MELLERLDITRWDAAVAPEIATFAADALENGKLLYALQLPFELSQDERRFLTADCLDEKSKNISLRPGERLLTGTRSKGAEHEALLGMLQRYSARVHDLLNALLPRYAQQMQPGFTSFRPAEIAGRSTSWQSDDSKLHIDAFPSRPMRGVQVLRAFTNVNPEIPRVWGLGEEFEKVAARFLPQIRRPLPAEALALQLLGRVKGQRTEYDHFMLGIHDCMKADQEYQSQVSQTRVIFPPGATWFCFTDRVSHAAMSGQFVLEQTMYVSIHAMKNPQRAPLRVLEKLAGRKLAPSGPSRG
jgi:hypothetical protein